MDRQLSRNSTVFRQDPALRATFPGARKYPQITLQSGVLSGFPTALEPTLPPSLPGANAGALPPYRRASRLPLPRDDIPPQPPVVVCARSFRLRWPGYIVPLTLRLYSRVQYGQAG